MQGAPHPEPAGRKRHAAISSSGGQWYHCATMQSPDERRHSGTDQAGARSEAKGTPLAQPRPVAGAGGVTFDARGGVLVLRHVNGDWVFPKGHIEPGESALQAALREVHEEAGIHATCPDPQLTFSTSYRNAHGVERHITWFVLAAEGAAAPTTEPLFTEALFAPPSEALRRLTFKQDRILLESVLATAPEGRA